MKSQTDQSYASYIEMPLSLINLIGGGQVHQHVNIPEEDAHQPIDLSFYILTPPSGAQGVSSEDFDNESEYIVVVRDKACRRREEDYEGPGAEWISPSHVHKYSHPSRWGVDRNDQYLYRITEAVRRILTSLNNQVAFSPLSTLRHMLVDQRTWYPRNTAKAWCTVCHVMVVPGSTLARRDAV